MSYVHPIPANQIPDTSVRDDQARDAQLRDAHFRDAQVTADARADQAQTNLSALAWGAIFAGAATAASLWMILMILGAGLGLTSIPLWLDADIAAGTFGAATIAWLVLSQVVASGMGGYMAGRMRNRWVGVPKDEVWFRDTAHGFLAWAVSALVTATLVTGMIGSVISDGIEASGVVAEAAPVAEIAEARVDSGRTDPYGEVQSRLGEVNVDERALAEQARKAAATAAIWLFISLLSGAFVASLMAIFGGRQRDA